MALVSLATSALTSVLTSALTLLLTLTLTWSSSSLAAPSVAAAKEPLLSADAEVVPPQTLLFHNARLALREGRPVDVLRLWLLRNALESQGEVPTNDDDFRSVVWAALGETGFCQDGFIEDDAHRRRRDGAFVDVGAGLWPLAMHNWLIKNRRRQPSPGDDTWSSFRGGVQQRPVSLYDVLSFEELRTVRFSRAFCLAPWVQQPRLLIEQGGIQWVDMDDRLSVALMMREMIKAAERTLSPELVTGRALLETRRFDLDVAITRLQASKAKQETGLMDQALREAGVSPGGRWELKQREQESFGRSPEAILWRNALLWPAEEWLSLSLDRRLALFDDADRGLQGYTNLAARHRLVGDVADALLKRRDGLGLTRWLGFVSEPDLPAAVDNPEARRLEAELLRATFTEGLRGEQMLALDPGTGFRERSAISLRRGVKRVGDGDLLGALQSFAFALAHADESSDADTIHRLSRRWLAFVLSQYATTDDVVAIVERFVPVADYGVVVESLLWRAAFHQDQRSFDLVCDSAERRKAGSVRRQCVRLTPLVEGDPGRLWTSLLEVSGEAGTLRFGSRLVDELATEPIDVRYNQRQTLEGLLVVLDNAEARGATSVQKRARVLRLTTQALLDGLNVYDESVRGRVDAAAPDAAAYAGSVRLAPADHLPWPFPRPQVTPPSPFAPIRLRPVERARGQTRLSGWRLEDDR